MDYLPQDLYELISVFIADRDDKEALLTVSRRWQATIERQRFRKVTANSMSGLTKLRGIFLRKERRRYLKVLTYNIVLPAYQEEQRIQFEEAKDREINDDAFTKSFEELFAYLSEWTEEETGKISLVLGDVYSLSDHEANKMSSPFLYMPRATFDIVRSASYAYRWQMTPFFKHTIDLLNWRHRYSHLRLLRLASLRQVPIIRSFSTAPLRTRNVNDVVSIDIATRLPNLEELNIRMTNVDKKYVAHWRELRREFAEAVEHNLPACRKIQTLEIWTSEKSQWLPEFAKPGSDDTGCGPDVLSMAIHTATTQLPDLRHLKVNGYVDVCLLRPLSSTSIKAPSYWQNLEVLVVQFETRRPRGKDFLFDKHDNPIVMPADTVLPPGHSDAMYRPQNEEELRQFAESEARARSTFTNVKRSLGIKSRETTTLEERFMEKTKIETARRFQPYRTLSWYPYIYKNDKEPAGSLIQAFGHVCCQLPKLKAAGLHTTRNVPKERQPYGRTWREDEVRAFPWGVWYLGPGVSKIDGLEDTEIPFTDERFESNLADGRVFWETRDWKPDRELMHLYERVGEKRYGRPARSMSRWWTE